MHAVALPTSVSDIIDEYVEKNLAVEATIAEFQNAFAKLELAATVQGVFVDRIADRPSLHVSTMRKNLLSSGWKAVYNRLRIGDIASAKDKQLFERTLAAPPELTRETAFSTFRDYYERPRFHILRGPG